MKSLICVLVLSFLNISQAARIIKYNGQVSLNGEPLNSTVLIKNGDIIEAKGKKSFFIVKYKDGSRFVIKEGKLKIKKIDRKRKKSYFELIHGLMMSFVNPKSKNKFTVKSKDATFGVRGTKFLLQANKDYSYLCVCEGKIKVKRGKKYIMVKKGRDLTVKKQDKKLSVSKANSQMWKMAQEGFEILDIKIEAL